MREDIPEDATDADDLFGDVDFDANPVKVESVASLDEPQPKVKTKVTQENPFEAVEDVLGLPKGSTKEGLALAKEEVKKVTGEAKALGMKAKGVAQKMKLARDIADAGIDDELGDAFSLDSLENDRRMLRTEYVSLFARGKKMLDRIESEMEDLVNPGPDEYGNYQRQYLALLTTLNGIKDTLVMLRKEEEIYSQRTAGVGKPGGVNGGVNAGPNGGVNGGVNGETGAGPNDESCEMTAQETNFYIDKWVRELDEEVNAEIERDYEERKERQASEESPPQLPAP